MRLPFSSPAALSPTAMELRPTNAVFQKIYCWCWGVMSASTFNSPASRLSFKCYAARIPKTFTACILDSVLLLNDAVLYIPYHIWQNAGITNLILICTHFSNMNTAWWTYHSSMSWYVKQFLTVKATTKREISDMQLKCKGGNWGHFERSTE